MSGPIAIEPGGSHDAGVCACCGNASRCVWGYAIVEARCVAAYYVHWTLGHVAEHGAAIDLIIGEWGDGASAEDRGAVSLVYRLVDGGPMLMIGDANTRPIARSDLVGKALGTLIAEQAFALADAVLGLDARIAELRGA